MGDGNDRIFVIEEEKNDQPKVVRPTGGTRRAVKTHETSPVEMKELEPIVIDSSDASFNGKTVKERQLARAELEKIVQETIEKKKQIVLTERGIDGESVIPLSGKGTKPVPECLEKVEEFNPFEKEFPIEAKGDKSMATKPVEISRVSYVRPEKPGDPELASKLKAYAILNMSKSNVVEEVSTFDKVIDGVLRIMLFPFYKGRKRKSTGLFSTSEKSSPLALEAKRRELHSLAEQAALARQEKARKDAAIAAELNKERKEKVVLSLDPEKEKGVDIKPEKPIKVEKPPVAPPIAKEHKPKVNKIDDTDFII
jgi:hypothetical protein